MINNETSLKLVAQSFLDKKLNSLPITVNDSQDLNAIKKLFINMALKGATQPSENFSINVTINEEII